MACYQVRTITTEFGLKTSLRDLKSALEELGFRVDMNVVTNEISGYNRMTGESIQFNGATGKLTHSENFNVASLKVGYAKAVVKSKAQEKGFDVVRDKEDPNRLRLRRKF